MDDFKDITLNIKGTDRKFRITRFNATTGAYILFKLTSVLAPLFESNQKDMNIAQMIGVFGKIPKDDFEFIQREALQICGEVLPNTIAPVMRNDGTFGVIGLEKDTITVLKLTIQALQFNLADFFGENGLGSLIKNLIPKPSPSSAQ